ncbi:MAG: hypothetical protein LHW59_09245 [Candidatus Cloacimonetes bacterium]|nr:hypothetical protein [Candidatus Cloacimonadota bacterium]
MNNNYGVESVGKDCTKNNNAWNAVFDKLPILDEIASKGVYHITASELNDIGKRQPQLMTNIESVHNLPGILLDNSLCIIPDGDQGNYIIGHFDAFQDVDFNPTKLKAETFEVERHFDTLDPFSIKRGPSAILAAYNNRILDDIIGNPTTELRMTNYGTTYTEPFEFTINNKKGGKPYTIAVGRSQLEMDGVFETDECVINIEAKNGMKTNFLTGQLYYPFRYLEKQTDKDIVNIFLTCSTGSIFAHVFHVDDRDNYNSMRLMSSHRYNFYEDITVSEVAELIRSTECTSDPPDLIIPQADSIQKVFDSLELINYAPGITDNELGYQLSIVNRQGGYYGNACNYLGLTERKRDGRSFNNYISHIGREILTLSYKDRILAIIKQMLRHKVFNHFLKGYLDQPPTKKEIEEWLKDNIPDMNNNSTPGRRAGTITSWINWVIDTCNADI